MYEAIPSYEKTTDYVGEDWFQKSLEYEVSLVDGEYTVEYGYCSASNLDDYLCFHNQYSFGMRDGVRTTF